MICLYHISVVCFMPSSERSWYSLFVCHQMAGKRCMVLALTRFIEIIDSVDVKTEMCMYYFSCSEEFWLSVEFADSPL